MRLAVTTRAKFAFTTNDTLLLIRNKFCLADGSIVQNKIVLDVTKLNLKCGTFNTFARFARVL